MYVASEVLKTKLNSGTLNPDLSWLVRVRFKNVFICQTTQLRSGFVSSGIEFFSTGIMAPVFALPHQPGPLV
jgi:hypothetical protein